MYGAVYYWGPRWELKQEEKMVYRTGPDGGQISETITVTVPVTIQETDQPPASKREKLEQLVREKNLSLDDLRQLDPESL
jgi:hypothetical protein